VIGNRQLTILRAPEDGSRDAEGRRTAGTPAPVATVTGNLFDRAMTYTDDDGQQINVFSAHALLPASTDIRTQDLIEASGIRYRVQTVTLRFSPFGAVHHKSARCVREDRNG
jgi:uncharacterized protein YqjF (DUF2071 family)